MFGLHEVAKTGPLFRVGQSGIFRFVINGGIAAGWTAYAIVIVIVEN